LPSPSLTHLLGNTVPFDDFQNDNSIIEVEARMSLQKLFQPFMANASQDVFFVLESRCSEDAPWSQLSRFDVELTSGFEIHTKHIFAVPNQFRPCPFLHMVVSTNSAVRCSLFLSFFFPLAGGAYSSPFLNT